MQPYQKAEKSLRSSGETPINIAKNLGLSVIGGGAATLGSSAVGSIIPKIKALINDFVPDNFAMKGLEKIDPRFKKFIQGAVEAGYDQNEIKNFIGEKLDKTEKNISIESKNIIQKHSPELHQFIDEQIKNGRSPLEAAGIAKVQPKFADAIKKLVKDHKTPWASIIESVYGTGERALPQQSENGIQDQPQSQPGQGGQGQQALAAILAQINQKLGPR